MPTQQNQFDRSTTGKNRPAENSGNHGNARDDRSGNGHGHRRGGSSIASTPSSRGSGRDWSGTDQYTSNSRSYGNANQAAQDEQDREGGGSGGVAKDRPAPRNSLRHENQDWDQSSDYNQPGGGRSPTDEHRDD